MNKIKLQGFLIAVLLLKGLSASAQDHLYSQFFNSPLYLNPALTGQFEGNLRMNLIYRNQWTTVPGPLSYASGSIDINIPKFGGGVGLLVTRGSEGTAYLDKTNISGLYSYSVGSDDFVLSFGLQAGVTNRSINLNDLVFDQQLDPTLGIIGTASAASNFPNNNKFFFDSGAGTNLVIADFNIGVAVQHINQPNESFTGLPAKLPMRFNANISYRLDLEPFADEYADDKSYVIPSVVYYKQADFVSYSAGVQFKRHGFNIGISYRSGAKTGPSAAVVTLIFDIFTNKETGEKFRFGVSHDAAVQGLTYGNTAGTTEGALSYETPLGYPFSGDNQEKKFEGATRCYQFY